MVTLSVASETEAVKKVSTAMIAELQQTLRQGILFATVSIYGKFPLHFSCAIYSGNEQHIHVYVLLQ